MDNAASADDLDGVIQDHGSARMFKNYAHRITVERLETLCEYVEAVDAGPKWPRQGL